MRFSLTGMSGSGKSLWSSRLAAEGFRRFCCDDLIAAKLSDDLTGADGVTMDLGEWMGFPYESRYGERERKYLECEVQVMREILDYLSSVERMPGEKIVVDTTGSVIYTGDEILKALYTQSTVVHLAVPHEVRLQMLEKYLNKPRPVLWQGMFHRRPHETNEEALARCYPELLVHRERLYERLAYITIPYGQHHRGDCGVEEFLRTVCQIEKC